MNFYPEQLRAIVTYLDALNEADKKLGEDSNGDTPYLKGAKVTDPHGTDLGELRDEIGSSWSWTPPEAA